MTEGRAVLTETKRARRAFDTRGDAGVGPRVAGMLSRSVWGSIRSVYEAVRAALGLKSMWRSRGLWLLLVMTV